MVDDGGVGTAPTGQARAPAAPVGTVGGDGSDPATIGGGVPTTPASLATADGGGGTTEATAATVPASVPVTVTASAPVTTPAPANGAVSAPAWAPGLRRRRLGGTPTATTTTTTATATTATATGLTRGGQSAGAVPDGAAGAPSPAVPEAAAAADGPEGVAAADGDAAQAGPDAKEVTEATDAKATKEAADAKDANGTAGHTKAEASADKDEDSEDEDNEKNAPDVTAVQALRVAWPWLVPRTARLRALLLLAMLCEVLSNTGQVVQPLLLRYAMDGLTLSAVVGGAASPAATVTGASEPAPALLFGRWALPPVVYRRPLVAIIGYICTGYMSGMLRYARYLAWRRAEEGLVLDVRVQTFAHIHSLSLKWHLNRNTNKVMHTFRSGARSVTDLLETCSFEIFPELVQFILNITILWRIGSWSLALLALGSVLLYALFTYAVTRVQMRNRKKEFKAEVREAGRAADSLLTYENVKVFGAEAIEVRRYRALLERQDRRGNRSRLTYAFLYNGQHLIQSLCVAGGLVLSGQRVMGGAISVADFVAVRSYLSRIFSPVSYAGYIVRSFTSSLLSLRQLVALHKEKPDVVDAPGAVPLVLHPTATARGGRVEFQGVSFSYGDDSAGAVDDVTFSVPAGTTTAIVGPTGAGKTTIMRLMLRLFDTTAGRITVDGQDISRVTQQSLRDAIGVVTQETTLLRDSIRCNVAYGRDGGEGVPDKAVTAAADVAQLSDWVARLPKGLDSVCGERGVRLSGGERQRVGIARVAIRDPAVLLLDESSSSLDSETERAMQTALQAATQGATTIVVAHRLSTVVRAREILVLDKGRIVERGTHAELILRDGGKYRRMWELQHAVDGVSDGVADDGAGSGADGATAVGGEAAAVDTTGAADVSGVRTGEGPVAADEGELAGPAVAVTPPAGGATGTAAGSRPSAGDVPARGEGKQSSDADRGGPEAQSEPGVVDGACTSG